MTSLGAGQTRPAITKKPPRIAIAHHWFVTQGGGEKVVEILADLFPSADIFTLLAEPQILSPGLRAHSIRESFLAKIPRARKFHRHLLPLYPLAANCLDLSGYDLILSSDSGPIKGVKTRSDAIHVCYCHSPMRYLWDQSESYALNMGGLSRTVFTKVVPLVRRWDFNAAQRVSYFLANSRFVADRILQCYGRESEVIYPGIEADRGRISTEISDSYLFVGRLVPYKRVDLLIKACNQLQRKLRIVGAGPEEASLRSIAGDTIEFLGHVDSERLWREYSRCRAFLFAAEEDCGMAPLEAQACGRPVIAYGRGGSCETVAGWNQSQSSQENPSGLFFHEQSVNAVVSAILSFESLEDVFSPISIQRRARSFDISCFAGQIRNFLQRVAPQVMELAS